MIQEGKNNLKQLWTTVGDIINPSKLKRTNKINKFIMKNKILENDEDIASAMNTYFSQIRMKLAAKFPNNKSTWKNESLHPSWSQWTMKNNKWDHKTKQ